MSILLYVDDIRNPEKMGLGTRWTWVKTIQEAIRILDEQDVSECSIDHDISLKVSIGYGDARPFASPETYEPVARFIRQLVLAQIAHGDIAPSPKRVYLHSANPTGRAKMLAILSPINKIIHVEEHPSAPCNRFEDEE
jgi:hypothetical protein